MTDQRISEQKSLSLGDGHVIESVRERTRAFKRREGRRPRILVANLRVNEPFPDIKGIAAGFANMGFDVDINPSFQSPEKIAKMALENDVHVVGLSGVTDGQTPMVLRLAKILETEGNRNVLIVVQGNITGENHGILYEAGVKEICSFDMTLACFGNNLLNLLDNK